MNSELHRHVRALGPAALVLLVGAVGCSSTDDGASIPVPRPGAAVAGLCRNLDGVLPAVVDGERRADPSPASTLTAGWGDSAIILRCGVPRPSKMVDPDVAAGHDPDAVPGGVDGVDWLMEKMDGGAYRFTTANRDAYVEVTVPAGYDTSGVLVDLASAIKRAVPERKTL